MLKAQKLLNYTTLYRSGEPFHTEAVEVKIIENHFMPENSNVTCQKNENGGFTSRVKDIICEIYDEQGDVFRYSIAAGA